jgi:hypothetical protein
MRWDQSAAVIYLQNGDARCRELRKRGYLNEISWSAEWDLEL